MKKMWSEPHKFMYIVKGDKEMDTDLRQEMGHQ